MVGEVGYASPSARGSNITANVLFHLSKYHFEKLGYEISLFNVTGMYMLKNLKAWGFQIEDRVVYEEFEYKGERPFKDGVKKTSYYLDEKPA